MGIQTSRLKRLAQDWGGTLTHLPKTQYDKIHQKNEKLPYRERTFEYAPFTSHRIGVMWAAKRVVYTGRVPWTVMTHELGHCFAASIYPDMSREFNFFGWELYLVEHIGGDMGVWEKANKQYIVTNDGGSLGDLVRTKTGRKELDAIYRERKAFARKHGLVSSTGVPLTIR